MRDNTSTVTTNNDKKGQGCAQSERLDHPLKTGYLLLEERSLEDLLAMGVAFAKQVKFIDENNQLCGSWAGLLTSDETIILALISQKNNYSRFEEQFLTLIKGRYDDSPELLVDLIKLNISILTTIDQWYAWSKQRANKIAKQLQAKLLEIIQFHRSHLSKIKEWLTLNSEKVDSNQAIFHSLQAAINELSGLSKAWQDDQEDGSHDRHPLDRQYLENCFHSLQHSIGYLSDFAKPRVKASLNIAQHDPACALFIGFILLLGKVSTRTNHFVDDHQHFYYSQLLNILPKQPQSDYTQLVLTSHKKTIVPQNTIFICEATDQQDELYYQSERPVMVVDGAVAQLANIYIQHDPLNVPAYNLGLVTNIHGQCLDDNKLANNQAQSLFGAPLIINQQTRREQTTIGFAIGSNILRLKQGLRQVTLNLVLEKRHLQNTIDENIHYCVKTEKRKVICDALSECLLEEKLLTDDCLAVLLDEQCTLLAEGAKQRYQALKVDAEQSGVQLTPADRQLLIEKIFGQGFQIAMTGEEGWQSITSYDFDLLTPKQSPSKHIEFTISFQLPRSVPAIVNFDQSIHGLAVSDQFIDQQAPVIRFLLNQESLIYSYSLLADLVLLQANIEVEVTGLKDLQIYNDFGPVNPTSPFMPFGAQPVLGSSLIVGSNEFSFKKVNQLSLDIEWAGLPQKRGGFETYYKTYELGITNDSFQVYPQILQDGLWYPEIGVVQQQGKSPQPQPLFTIDQEGYLTNWQTVVFSDLELFKPAKGKQYSSLNFTTQSMNGFVRFQLTGAEHSFAHQQYPVIMGKKMTETIRLKIAKPPELPPPYTPMITRISANYQASCSIYVEKLARESKQQVKNSAGEVYTLYPFGARSFSEKIHYETGYLLPQYSFQGAVYIGLKFKSSFTGGRLSLLIDVDPSSIARIRHTTCALNWALLRHNVWLEIDGKYVLADDTNGFLTPGIITLELPEALLKGEATLSQLGTTALNCHIMDPDLFWLRVSTQDDPACYCQLRDIQLNAVRVRWVVNCEASRSAILAAENRFKLQQSIEGITSVSQPLPSVRGKLKESVSDWSQRCAERLRHRNRAVQAWDYERIVLETFPNIARVKCFTAQSFQQPHQVAAGHVLIIVIPTAAHLHNESTASELSQPPQPISAIELEQINQTLQQHCTPGVTIEVANPIYERVQLRCSVVFNSNASDINGHSALNDAISHYLSAWGKYKITPTFDWQLQPDIIEAFIRDLPYIAYVTNLSLIKVTPLKDGRYELLDSVISVDKKAPPSQEKATCTQRDVYPKYPWGIVLPFAQHGIESLGQANNVLAERTGVDELALGSSFVIGH
ncbi:baseplate J/gp47 family protein [Spartinivicinus ruber]|uniref:baseplate J/gp47 family protein n=1 Tax=Spartinivicinus ruber TaxID=2683272 RepID=UPI0013D27971|nr:baseplate J/gp47 family protein [Spartinivicinus ruber]